MPFQRASQALSRYTVLDLTPRPLWADLRAAARGLEGQCHQEDAGGEQPGGPRRGSDFDRFSPKKGRGRVHRGKWWRTWRSS
jgi:hypothetical protein